MRLAGELVYRDLATFYDNAFRDHFSELMVHHICNALRDHALVAPARLLDLGCGTGLLAMGLHKRGYHVTGIDQSDRMLDIARRRIERDELEIDLRVGDIRAFELEGHFDVAVCTGDTVNHLLEPQELVDTFSCVHDALAPGGVFVFDMNNLIIYRSQLWNCTDAKAEGANYSMTCTARFNERSGIGRLSLHVEEETPMTTKELRGSIRQRYWSDEDITKMLGDAGFYVESARTFHPFGAPQEYPWLEAGKTLWVASRD
jgi:SAM-dependent methyltransferase